MIFKDTIASILMSKVQGAHKKCGFGTASTKDIQKSFVCNWREVQVKGRGGFCLENPIPQNKYQSRY